jgi:hypothetical protein
LATATRRVALASSFGVIIFLTLGFIPPPNSDFLIVVQAFFLSLSFLVLGRFGATYVGVVSGLLITYAKIQFFPYDLVFASVFGVVVDILGTVFRARVGAEASSTRMVLTMTLSTGIVGFAAYYVTAVATKIVPNDVGLDLTVIGFGVVSGAVGGFLAARLWNRNLKARFAL